MITPPPRSENPPSSSVLFLGDTGFGESYHADRAERGRTDVLAVHGYEHAIGGVTGLLAGHDLVVANLETPLCRALDAEEAPDAPRDNRYLHWSDPERTAAVLGRHGVTAVSLANNHAYDQGEPGLRRTLETLARSGIAAFGAGMHEGAARRPFIAEVPCGDASFRLAVVGAKMHLRRSRRGIADGVKAGVSGWDPITAARQIAMLRRSDPGLFIVAFPHWGENYEWRNEAQIKLALALVGAGADLVLGHGSHAIQEIERVGDRWIVFGIGNFLFGSPGRYSRYPDVLPYGFAARLIARLVETPDGACVGLRLRLYAVRADNRATNFRPEPASIEEMQAIEAALRARQADTERHGWSIVQDERGPALDLDLDVALPLAPSRRATAILRLDST